MATTPITGVPTSVSVRPEISSWSSSPDPIHKIQVSLFIRALRELQEKDTLTDHLSFYRLAGIHFSPSQPWDNDTHPPPYCTHNKVTFPTWHRPYMALYEQCLYNNMIKIINSGIVDPLARQEWTSAAGKWRLPFWDWALPQADTGDFGVPGLVLASEVNIYKLGKREEEPVLNPLHKFTNKLKEGGILKKVPMGDSRLGKYAIKLEKFDQCIGTSRYGIFKNKPPQDWVEGVNNDERVKESLKPARQATGSIAHNVFRLLSDQYFKSYEPFASTIYQDQHSVTEYLSLEMIHNNIHNWTGGSNSGDPNIGTGHMTLPNVAAFDPIFWLHHCNVDRLLAIWQFLNSQKWFDNPFPKDPKPTDSLPPFHKDEIGTLYTSNDARAWTKLGYNYPELVNTTPEALAVLIRQKYGGGFDRFSTTSPVPGIESDRFRDYVINIRYDRYALNGRPYMIQFYLVQPQLNLPDNVLNLGSIYNFSSQLELSADGGCENCKSQKEGGVLSKAQLPITLPLFDLAAAPSYPNFSNMKPDHVEVLLQDQLHWRIITNLNEEVNPEGLSGLLITVHGGKARYPTDGSPLVAFDPTAYEPLYGATHGKPSGARRPS